MPSGAIISGVRSGNWAFNSCKQIMSALWAAAQGNTFLLHAERIPLRFREMMRNIVLELVVFSDHQEEWKLWIFVRISSNSLWAAKCCALANSKPRQDGFRP